MATDRVGLPGSGRRRALRFFILTNPSFHFYSTDSEHVRHILDPIEEEQAKAGAIAAAAWRVQTAAARDDKSTFLVIDNLGWHLHKLVKLDPVEGLLPSRSVPTIFIAVPTEIQLLKEAFQHFGEALNASLVEMTLTTHANLVVGLTQNGRGYGLAVLPEAIEAAARVAEIEKPQAVWGYAPF